MDISEKKAYVEKVLHYLEKDWEWSPILLGLLEDDDLDERRINELAKWFDETIRGCKNEDMKKRLMQASEIVQEMLRKEKEEIRADREEANALLGNYS